MERQIRLLCEPVPAGHVDGGAGGGGDATLKQGRLYEAQVAGREASEVVRDTGKGLRRLFGSLAAVVADGGHFADPDDAVGLQSDEEVRRSIRCAPADSKWSSPQEFDDRGCQCHGGILAEDSAVAFWPFDAENLKWRPCDRRACGHFMALAFDPGAIRRYVERAIQDLPALPAAVAKVLELTQSETASSQDIEKALAGDTAIAGKMLRVVNSAYYGLPHQVDSIGHAVVILGMRQIRNLVLSLAAMSLVRGRATLSPEAQLLFWRHSFGVGASAQKLAEDHGADAHTCDTAQLCGLLHDIGRLFLLCHFPDLYRATVRAAETQGIDLTDGERVVLCIDHAEVGEAICRAWSLPDAIAEPVGEHHTEFTDYTTFLGRVTRSADWIVTSAGIPSVEGNMTHPCQDVIAWLKMGPDEIHAHIEHVNVRVTAAEEFFGIL